MYNKKALFNSTTIIMNTQITRAPLELVAFCVCESRKAIELGEKLVPFGLPKFFILPKNTIFRKWLYRSYGDPPSLSLIILPIISLRYLRRIHTKIVWVSRGETKITLDRREINDSGAYSGINLIKCFVRKNSGEWVFVLSENFPKFLIIIRISSDVVDVSVCVLTNMLYYLAN